MTLRHVVVLIFRLILCMVKMCFVSVQVDTKGSLWVPIQQLLQFDASRPSGQRSPRCIMWSFNGPPWPSSLDEGGQRQIPKRQGVGWCFLRLREGCGVLPWIFGWFLFHLHQTRTIFVVSVVSPTKSVSLLLPWFVPNVSPASCHQISGIRCRKTQHHLGHSDVGHSLSETSSLSFPLENGWLVQMNEPLHGSK